MIRKSNDKDISEEEWNNILNPFYDNYTDFMESYVMPEVIVFYITCSFYRNAMWESTFKDHYNFEKEPLNIFNENYFVAADAWPVSSNTLTDRKNNNCAKAGVKQIRLHDFRHSCASLLINKGANIQVVAKYLGHTKIEETLKTYSHLFISTLDEIVDVIDNLENDKD